MDVAIVWDAARSRGDWAVTSGDLQIDRGGLRTAVLLSLFTDKRASDDYASPAGSPSDLRGAWMDTYQGFQIGSLLWTLNRVAISNSATFLSQAKDICLDALEWLVSASVVATVNVTTSLITPTTLGILIVLTEPDGTPQTMNFAWAWQGA